MAEGKQAREMGERMRVWLDGPADSSRLVEWLQGHGFPPVGYADEPYLWLLRGIESIAGMAPTSARDQTYSELFCERIARLLDERPDEQRPGVRPEQVLYNLFLLCAGLKCPDCLADPLSRILARGKLNGSYLGVDLREALRSALAENQIHERMREEWLAMIRGESRFLPGDEYAGFAGLWKMPESPVSRGEPALRAIEAGLAAFVARLDHENDEIGRARLVEIVDSLRRAYPRFDDLDRFLIGAADRRDWPKWALSTLVPLCRATDDAPEWYAWRLIADCVNHAKGVSRVASDTHCDGFIVRLHVTNNSALKRIQQIAGRIADVLDEHKELRYRSILCYINAIMMDFEDKLDDAKVDIAEARRGLLTRVGVLAGAGAS